MPNFFCCTGGGSCALMSRAGRSTVTRQRSSRRSANSSGCGHNGVSAGRPAERRGQRCRGRSRDGGHAGAALPTWNFLQLIQKDLEEDEERSPSQGSLRFRHKQPVELKGPDGIHVVHGSTGTLLASDLNSLPEDDQKVLGRSLETLTADCGAYDHNARTESAKSTPLHKMREVIMESPLEITEL